MKTEVNAEKYERRINKCRKNISKDIKIKEEEKEGKMKQMYKNREKIKEKRDINA